MDAKTPKSRKKKLTPTQLAAQLAAKANEDPGYQTLDEVLAAKPTETAIPKTVIVISPPRFRVASIDIEGTNFYVSNKFSSASRKNMIAKQEAGSQAQKGRKREPKDFEKVFQSAIHYSEDNWCGIPASAFRAGMISACRLVGFKMTLAKLSVFCLHDGLDRDDGSPLVRIIGPAPVGKDVPVRLADGSTDIIRRPFFRPWACKLRFEFDLDQFSDSDITHLLMRVGLQVGVGAGRPDSRSSTGMGWGTFKVLQ